MTLFAHGLVGKADLPIPLWLFIWSAAAVLVISFAALGMLWSRPVLEQETFRPLPSRMSRLLTSRVMEIVCGAIGFALFVAVLLWRAFCEFYVTVFKISEDLHVLRQDVERERAGK